MESKTRMRRRRASATARSAWSPIGWPQRSLTDLKWSTSTIITAMPWGWPAVISAQLGGEAQRILAGEPQAQHHEVEGHRGGELEHLRLAGGTAGEDALAGERVLHGEHAGLEIIHHQGAGAGDGRGGETVAT